jgi:hypothetical protein
MTQQHEINEAYYQGLREMNGVDPAVAEDLGIPMSPEAMDRHVAAGHEVDDALARASQPPVSPAAAAMHTWIAGADRKALSHDIRGEISRQAKNGDILKDEVDVLFDAIKVRRESFRRRSQ